MDLASPERHALISQLSSTLHITTLDSASWAVLWLSDIERLCHLVRKSIRKPQAVRLSRIRIPDPWKVRRDPAYDDLARVLNRCTRRDIKCCITSAMEPTEVAHIIPFTLGGACEDNDSTTTITATSRSNRNRNIKESDFWRTLRCFFNPDRVNRWKAAAMEVGSASNMLVLSADAHGLLGKARFGLEPVTGTGAPGLMGMGTVEAAFHWLPASLYGGRDVLDCPGPLLDDGRNGSVNGGKLFDFEREEVIRGGHAVVFRSLDEVRYPLPAWDGLDMHWVMSRVVALSGVGDLRVGEREGDSEDEDEDGHDIQEGEECGYDCDEEAEAEEELAVVIAEAEEEDLIEFSDDEDQG
ncbi:hypothetical protein BJX76DRAFT_359606 [Aspergillus varians]